MAFCLNRRSRFFVAQTPEGFEDISRKVESNMNFKKKWRHGGRPRQGARSSSPNVLFCTGKAKKFAVVKKEDRHGTEQGICSADRGQN